MGRILIAAVLMLVVLSALGLRAQDAAEPIPTEGSGSSATAEPLGPSELDLLMAAVPREGLVALAVAQVGQILSPTLFDDAVAAVERIAPGVGLEGARGTYDAEIAPLAVQIRGCVIWAAPGPGVVCLGDFGPDGFDPVGERLAECGAEDESCGSSDRLFEGHRIAWLVDRAEVYRVDETYLVLAEEGAGREAVGRLVAALDSQTPPPRPTVGGLIVDGTTAFHGLGLVPEELSREADAQFDFELTLDLASVRLTSQASGGLDLEAFVECGSEAASSQLRSTLQILLMAAFTSDPTSAAAFGLSPEEMVETIDSSITSDGARLVVRLDSRVLMGTLAAIAIPTVVGYVTRAKTAEAAANLQRLADGATAYYLSEQVDASGTVLPRQFPASAPRTPSAVPCGEAAAPQAGQWETPTWQALDFAVGDPAYYSYQFDSVGTGLSGSFTASAFGDLDCDGHLSTFVRVGTLAADGSVTGPGLYQSDELE